MDRKYQLPTFLAETPGQRAYERWLARKAAAHVRRDRRRGNTSCSIEAYKVSLHKAVIASGGRDQYTGDSLRWDLISTYDNDGSKAGRREYKAGLGLLPTVDHVGDGVGPADFKICAWRTNAAKSDLNYDDFVELCRRIIDHHQKRTEKSDPL